MPESTTAATGFHLGSATPGTKIIHLDDMDFSQERGPREITSSAAHPARATVTRTFMA